MRRRKPLSSRVKRGLMEMMAFVSCGAPDDMGLEHNMKRWHEVEAACDWIRARCQPKEKEPTT